MASVTPAQIDAAADGLALQRLQTKLQAEAIDNAKAANEAALASAEASRAVWARQAAAAEAMLAAFQQQATVLDAGSTRGELAQRVFVELLPGYMKGTTATVPETQQADVAADGRYLGYAMAEAMRQYDAFAAAIGVDPSL